jgi:hypothetical protein
MHEAAECCLRAGGAELLIIHTLRSLPGMHTRSVRTQATQLSFNVRYFECPDRVVLKS